MKDLISGYTFEFSFGAVYHFEHIPVGEADEMLESVEYPHVIETVNTTHAAPNSVHFNKYYARTLAEAIGLAARMQIGLVEVGAEDIVGIRPATEEEVEGFEIAEHHFMHSMPEAIPDN